MKIFSFLRRCKYKKYIFIGCWQLCYIVDNYIYVNHNLYKFQIDTIKIEALLIQNAEEFHRNRHICADELLIRNFFHVVDNYMAYNLQKFQIDSSQIEISTNFFIPWKFFCILKMEAYFFAEWKDCADLYLWAINLKFFCFIGPLTNEMKEFLRNKILFLSYQSGTLTECRYYIDYNLWKFQIDSSQIEISTNFFLSHKQ